MYGVYQVPARGSVSALNDNFVMPKINMEDVDMKISDNFVMSKINMEDVDVKINALI